MQKIRKILQIVSEKITHRDGQIDANVCDQKDNIWLFFLFNKIQKVSFKMKKHYSNRIS